MHASKVFSFIIIVRIAEGGGAFYTRWGRTVCPIEATFIYKGFVAGNWYESSGGSPDLLCLPENPEYVSTETVFSPTHIHSAEYDNIFNQVFNIATHDYDIPCVVCRTAGSAIMIPATYKCPNGLNTEYSGYLMSNQNSMNANYPRLPTDTLCVDEQPEIMFGSQDNGDGATLHFVTADCNKGTFMPCAPYKHDVPLSCVVCS